ncbi:hypothetical protein ACGC1H_004290 [Rhizoctonia solani]
MPPPLSSNTQSNLPTEILISIFNYGHYRDFVPLARCSRLFHQLCNPLLYRDIYLHTSIQLVNLSKGENTSYLLSYTESMLIDDWALCLEGWGEVEGLVAGASPAECLIKIWKTTPSLRWLQVCRSDLPRADLADGLGGVPERLEANMDEEQYRLATDQTFLPRLAFAIYYERLRPYNRYYIRNPFGFLTRSRPGIFSSNTSNTITVVNINHESQTDVLETSLVSSDPESHQGVSWHRAAGLIESSLQVSPHWRANPGLLIVSCYNLGSSLNTRNVYPWMAKLITKIRPANTIPSLSRLMFRFGGLRTPDEVFKLDGQNSFFELINQVSPGINALGLKFPGLPWVRWIKTPLTSNKRRSHPDFPYWVPILSSFKDETYAWWIELLNLDPGFVGMPNVDVVQTMASELNWRFQLAYGINRLNQDLIARDLVEYYAR